MRSVRQSSGSGRQRQRLRMPSLQVKGCIMMGGQQAGEEEGIRFRFAPRFNHGAPALQASRAFPLYTQPLLPYTEVTEHQPLRAPFVVPV